MTPELHVVGLVKVSLYFIFCFVLLFFLYCFCSCFSFVYTYSVVYAWPKALRFLVLPFAAFCLYILLRYLKIRRTRRLSYV